MYIANVGYDSANYYVLGDSNNRLLVDVGWSQTLGKLTAMLKRKGIALQDLGYLLATHYHPDHAGLAQELKNLGVRLIVLTEQRGSIPLLKSVIKPRDKYIDIRLDDNLELTSDASRAFLKSIGIAGEIISTPGHSPDSITLILDKGAAFTGDLALPIMSDGSALVTQSWQAIREHGAKMVYPGHGPVRTMTSIV